LAHGDSGEVTAGVRQGDILAGKYRVERVLGAGGMGVVVAAYHLQLHQRVAIKFLLPEALNNVEAVERFAREARAAVKITSEHVARVIDVGTLETGAPYMVMEFLEGHDLARWVRLRGPLPLEQTVDFVLQACEALAEAHTLGIVHRDLKPANLFIVRGADALHSVKVLDFGISKATGPAAQDVALTRTAAVMGSPLYMSPEQMASSRNVDVRTDVWAIGVVLYELLTGHVPFNGDTLPEVCVKISSHPPPPLRDVRPDLPLAVEAIVLKCLEKDRERRFRNVGELTRALVPYGPPRARISAERIERVLLNAEGPTSAMPGAATPATAGKHERSHGPVTLSSSWGATASRGSGARWVIGALAAALAIATAAGIALLARRPLQVGPPPMAASVVDPLPPRPASVSATTLAPAPPASIAPVVSAAAEEPAASAPRPHPAPKPPAPIAKPTTPAVSCDPPFTVDSTGIKHPKPECL
jgi:eukaryotic-like serine/threonine-protein kinase